MSAARKPEDQPLVSVITPVYNGEEFLHECIESILGQTYRNFEYIIVNNFSRDRSLEIARRYAARDPRISVHDNTEFLGAIDNWNHALRLAAPESKYIKMVFADDWLFPECLQEMVAAGEAHPSASLVGSYRLAGTIVRNDGLPFPSHLVAGREVVRATLLGGPYLFGSPSSVLYRAELVRRRGDFFQPLPSLTDMEACFYLLQSGDFAFLHKVLTFSRPRPDSLTSSMAHRGADFPDLLQILKLHGPVFLTEAELERRWKYWMECYYEFLGQNVFYLRDHAFWAYHRAGLARVGLKLNRARVVGAAVKGFFGVLARPFRTLRKVFEFSWTLRRNKKSNPAPAAPALQSRRPRGESTKV